MTEEQIERRAEAKFDELDRQFMAGQITQEAYDRESLKIADWAERQHIAREMDADRRANG